MRQTAKKGVRSVKPVAVAPDNHSDKHVELANALGFLFRRLSSQADAAFLTRSNEPDLTPMQMGVLLTVERVSHISLRKLAREMHADRSTIQELVTRMVDRNLLDRRVSERDRRVHELWLTETGAAMTERNRLVVKQTQEDLLSPVSAEEADVLIDLLHRLLARKKVDDATSDRRQ